MANPTLPSASERLDYDNASMEVEGVIVNKKVVVSSQQAQVTDPAAQTSEALTGTLTGTALLALTDITYNGTWSQDQANEINLNIKVIQAQVNKLVADLTAVRTKLVAALDVLEAHGLMADA